MPSLNPNPSHDAPDAPEGRTGTPTPAQASDPSAPPPLDDEGTINLLRMAALDGGRPMDEVVARLEAPDGARWLAAQIDRIGMPEGATSSGVLDGSVPLRVLIAVMARATKLAGTSLDHRQRLAGLAVHDLCIAAAMVHHGVLPSRRPRDDWDDRLVRLSAATAEPWRRLLRAAADSESEQMTAPDDQVG